MSPPVQTTHFPLWLGLVSEDQMSIVVCQHGFTQERRPDAQFLTVSKPETTYLPISHANTSQLCTATAFLNS
jgi:hypothetical protein